MTNRERVNAVLHYQEYDRMPLVSFGYWRETLDRWEREGHVKPQDADDYRRNGDNGEGDRAIMGQLGFDFNWNATIGAATHLFPGFEEEVLQTLPDGSEVYRDSIGHIQKRKPGVVSIPAEVGTILTSRSVWEEEFLPRLQDDPARVDFDAMRVQAEKTAALGLPCALHCGSMFGRVRDMLGMLELSYLMADDEALFSEIVNTGGELIYKVVERCLQSGIHFDYAHFWEDICYKTGPLVSPEILQELIGPHYKRVTALLLAHGIDIVSVDCDGKIDALIPLWLDNGVNTMFPIEVGTWHASIAPWRLQYGKALRGVGGMDKRVFAQDRAAVDAEIERLRPLVALGGYIPCPDHRIAPDAEYPLVQYYCQQFRKAFG